MKKVWKFPLKYAGKPLNQPASLYMPKDSVVLSVLAPPLPSSISADTPVVVVYALVETNNTDSEEHRFQLVGTGNPDLEQGLDDDDILEFIGSVSIISDDRFGVFHLFEVKNEPVAE